MSRRLQDVVKKELHLEIENITNGFGSFLIRKDEKYGDAYSKMAGMMKILFPDGLPVERMDDGAYMYQICQKLARISVDHKEEDEDPWKDVAGTAFHAQAKRNIKKRQQHAAEVIKRGRRR